MTTFKPLEADTIADVHRDWEPTASTMPTFRPLEAFIGGLFIGAACGVYMLFSRRIAGCSGSLKAVLLGPYETSKIAFTGGLLSGGTLMKVLLPSSFSAPPAPSLLLAFSGIAVGIGTALANGCTSGHGLCGLSRLSYRSLVAVPIFMVAAIITTTISSVTMTITSITTTIANVTMTITSDGTLGAILPIAILPIGATPATTTGLAAQLARGLALTLAAGLALLPAKSTAREVYLGLWSGGCFAIGLSIGGMVRPSVVTGALGPAAFDGTLSVLFCTALATTFMFFRVAARVGVQEATVWGAASPTPVDSALVLGSVFFGVGWGASGLCPGPLLVDVGASGAPGLLLMLFTVALGMALARPISKAMECMLRKRQLGKVFPEAPRLTELQVSHEVGKPCAPANLAVCTGASLVK